MNLLGDVATLSFEGLPGLSVELYHFMLLQLECEALIPTSWAAHAIVSPG